MTAQQELFPPTGPTVTFGAARRESRWTDNTEHPILVDGRHIRVSVFETPTGSFRWETRAGYRGSFAGGGFFDTRDRAAAAALRYWETRRR